MFAVQLVHRAEESDTPSVKYCLTVFLIHSIHTTHQNYQRKKAAQKYKKNGCRDACRFFDGKTPTPVPLGAQKSQIRPSDLSFILVLHDDGSFYSRETSLADEWGRIYPCSFSFTNRNFKIIVMALLYCV